MKLLTVLEGGRVRRLHTVPVHQNYDVAGHSWGMAVACLALHPTPSPGLLKACLLHDVAERYTGDLPAPTKWIIPNLAKTLEEVEDKAMDEMGVELDLDEDDRRWLKGLDLLELYLFCVEEQRMGNRNVNEVRNVCHGLLFNGETPQEILDWLRETPYTDRSIGGWIS